MKKGLTVFQIKIVALIAMTLDHLATYIISNYYLSLLFHIIGRLSAPLFLFLLVEGFQHTANRKRYCLRLYIAGAVTQLINGTLEIALFTVDGAIRNIFNIFPALFYVSAFICILDYIKLYLAAKKVKKAILILALTAGILATVYSGRQLLNSISVPSYILRSSLCTIYDAILPSLSRSEYFPLLPVMGILWHVFKSRRAQVLTLLVCSMLYFVSPLYASIQRCNFNILLSSMQWCMVLTCPIIILYNGKQGAKCKYFYYLYYPLHQYVLVFLQFCGLSL